MTYILSNTISASARLSRAAVILGFGAIVALSNTTLANAHPSFSCAKTYSMTERAICKSSQLSRLDREMSSEYYALRRDMTRHDRRALRKDQRHWLKVRNRCGARRGCISDQYYFRIAALSEWHL